MRIKLPTQLDRIETVSFCLKLPTYNRFYGQIEDDFADVGRVFRGSSNAFYDQSDVCSFFDTDFLSRQHSLFFHGKDALRLFDSALSKFEISFEQRFYGVFKD